jgi:hypothetical protein
MDPQDGRAYVTLGKLMVEQRRHEEAKKLYEDGCAATGDMSVCLQAWLRGYRRQHCLSAGNGCTGDRRR